MDEKQGLNFAGRAVIVTGASGGIGAEIARAFARAKAGVVVGYRSGKDSATELVEEITALGGRASAVRADVTQKSDVERLVSSCIDAFGFVDILINNAGSYPMSSLLEMDEDEWDAVIQANLRSTFLCTQAAAVQMIEQGHGGIVVNIASVEAENPAPMHAHYCSAKAGVVMLTQAAAGELGSHGIRVNCVSPGLIWRPDIEKAWPDGVERWKRAAPLGRLGMPEDIANACLFFASDLAEWITGANLRVDGGVMTNQIF